MMQRDAEHQLNDAVFDDVCLGGERAGGKTGRSSENRIPFVAAVLLDAAGRPQHFKLSPRMTGSCGPAVAQQANRSITVAAASSHWVAKFGDRSQPIAVVRRISALGTLLTHACPLRAVSASLELTSLRV
ncbi:hypothetical protein [Roseateles sp. LKC17W]